MSFNWKNEFVLVTGASSGLGKALAIESARRGADVAIIARDKVRLSETVNKIESNNVKCFSYVFDLSEIDRINDLFRKISSDAKKEPTVLINNVGYQVAGFVQNTPVEVYERNYKVNTIAPVALIQSVLPSMLIANSGTIVNVMSSIMYRGFPGVSSYAASKSALGAIHESLKAELSETNIKTVYVQPGTFKSRYWKNTDIGERINGHSFPLGDSGADPVVVAEKLCDAIEERKETFLIRTIKDRVGHHLSYWAPRVLDRIIADRNKKIISKRPKL